MLFAALAVAIAIFVAVFMQGDDLVKPSRIKLGDPAYDMVPIQSPSASSTLLKVLTYVLTRSPLGPTIRRVLLKDNKIYLLRDLASQIKLPPLHFPMRRLSKEERTEVEKNDCAADDELCIRDVVAAAGNDSADHNLKSILDYHQAFLEGRTTPSKAAQKILATLHQWETENMNIFSSVIDDDVIRQAVEADKRYAAGEPLGVFDGVPVAFKDMLCIKGHKYYNGRDPKYADDVKVCDHDDELVVNFRRHGAIILGLTLQVEGGVTPLGYNSHWHGPLSAYSRNRYSGGSSSGSATAVATGLVPLAIGFDGGGSVRIPAAMSGLHGLATSFGRCAFGLEHLMSSLIKAGPIAANAVDAALGYAIMAQTTTQYPDHLYNRMYDGAFHGVPKPHLTGWKDIQDLTGVRLGVYPAWFNDVPDDIRQQTNAAIDVLKARGAEIVEINIPHLMVMTFAHAMKISTEFAKSFDVHYSKPTYYLEPNTMITVGIGMSSSALEQLSGDVIRHWGFNFVTSLFREHQLTAIVTPSLGQEVPILSEVAKEIGESNNAMTIRVMKYASLVNFLGLPGYSVPIGGKTPSSFDPNEDPATTRVPLGIQFIGDHWSDAKLLRLGHAIEEGFTRRLQPEKQMSKPIYYVNPLE